VQTPEGSPGSAHLVTFATRHGYQRTTLVRRTHEHGFVVDDRSLHCLEDNIAVVSRYRTVGVPIWATSTIVDPAGLAKAQEIMVVGGVLPADKKVDYDKIVTNVYAEKAQQKFASK